MIKITHNTNWSEYNNTDLIKAHAILHKWYKTGKKGFSKEDIYNLHMLLVNELKKRNIKHEPMDDLDKRIVTHSKITDSLTDAIILKDAVSLVGSILDKDNFHDVDILIRLNDIDYIKRAIMTRIDKMMPEGLPELHFVFEPSGAHDKFIPLFDLALIKREPQLIHMEKELLAFRPQKPFGDAYYNYNELVRDMYKQHNEWLIEKKWDGLHVIAIKQNGVKIYTEEGKNITNNLPTLVKAIKSLSDHKFIIDGELIYRQNGKLGTRRDLMKFVSGKDKDDKNVGIVVWDITYFDKCLMQLPLIERKKFLKKLKFNNRIKETKYSIAKSPAEARKLIVYYSKLERSEGAVVKRPDAEYKAGETSRKWLKYRKMADLKVRVIKRIPTATAGVYNYLFGIDLKQKDLHIVNPKYVTDVGDKKVLKLGKTFNVKEAVPEGSIINVKVEEIWRHEGKRGIRYSPHKPHFMSKASPPTSTIKDLDNIVVSLGVAVKEGEQLSRVADILNREEELLWLIKYYQ